MKKRATLADVAATAGVSLMTVSRAINNKPGVSDDLRQSILRLAAEMGYRPNFIARGLATRRTATVGLVVPDNTNPFFAQIARGVEDAAFQIGYSVFLVNTNEDPVRETSVLDTLWQKNIEGIILCSPRLPMRVLEEQIQRFPAVVAVNRKARKQIRNMISINVNDQRGAQLAVEHFVAHGRRKIACIRGPARSISGRRRLQGYRSALKSAGLPVDSRMVEPCSPDVEGGSKAAAALLARRPKIDAIYAFNDLAAVGAMQACQGAGKRIPGDIALIGADDIPLASIVRPRLTTLHVDLRHIGQLAMHSLLDMIQGEAVAAALQIEPELRVRDSA